MTTELAEQPEVGEPEVIAEPQQTEAIPTDETPEQPEEPDYKALAEQHEAAVKERDAEIQRITQQMKSAQGVARERLDVQAELGRIRRQGEQRDQIFLSALQAQIQGDTEGFNKAVGELTNRNAQEDAQTEVQDRVSGLWQNLHAEAKDVGVDLQASTEFAEVRDLWNRGFGMLERDRRQGLRLMQEASNAAAEVRRDAQVKERERVRQEAEDKVAQSRRESGTVSSPAVRASGRGGGSDAALEAAVADGKIAMTPEIAARLDKYWKQ